MSSSLESRINRHINHWLSNNAKQSVYELAEHRNISTSKSFSILHPVRYEVEYKYSLREEEL